MSTLGKAVIEFSADTAKFTGDVGRAAAMFNKNMDSMQGAIGTLVRSFSIIGSAAVMGAFIKSGVDSIAMLDDMAAKTSLSVETLSSLQRTAVIGGHSFDTVASAATKFAKNVAEAAGGNKDLIATFKALGISQEDLRSKKFDDLYVEFAKKVATAENKTYAIAYATKLAGKAAAESIPFWEDLAETGLEQSRVTTLQAAQAELLQKGIARLKDDFEGWRIEVANSSIPTMIEFLDQFREGIKIFGSFGSALLNIGVRLDPFKTAAENAALLRKEIEQLQKGRDNLSSMPGYSATIASIDSQIDNKRRQLEFVNYMQRQQALAGRTGAQFLDARDLQAHPALKGTILPPPPKDTTREEEALRKRQLSALQSMEEKRGSLLDQTEREIVLARTLTGSWKEFDAPTKQRLLQMADEIDKRKQVNDELKRNTEYQKILDAQQDQNSEAISGVLTSGGLRLQQMEFEMNLLGKTAEEQARLTALRELDLANLKARQTLVNGGTEEEIAKIDQITTAIREKLLPMMEQRNALERSWALGTKLAINDYVRTINDAAAQSAMYFGNAFRNMEDALVQFVRTGKVDFKSLANSILDDLARIQIQRSIMRPLVGTADKPGILTQGLDALGAVVAKGIGSIFSGGTRASGGAVSGGSDVLVGEHGPELFRPNTAGSIVGNHTMSNRVGSGTGGGPSNQFFVDMRGASLEAVARLERLVAKVNGSIERRAVRANAEVRAR